MHTELVMLLALMGAEPTYSLNERPSVIQVTASTECCNCDEAACDGSTCCAAGCSSCGAEAPCCPSLQPHGPGYFHAWFGPMPQTCYDPRFGCYPGNARTINRYPAFHGAYYRKPYNWRHYMEYPWHAAPHDPQRFFSMAAVPEAEGVPAVIGQPDMAKVNSQRLGLPARPAAMKSAKPVTGGNAASRQ